jgi:hypothetical protein
MKLGIEVGQTSVGKYTFGYVSLLIRFGGPSSFQCHRPSHRRVGPTSNGGSTFFHLGLSVV